MTIAAKPIEFDRAGSEPSDRVWDRREYDRMVELGFFDGQRVELIRGRILQMSPQRVAHRVALELADRFTRRAFSQGFRICIQMPFRSSDGSEPEPDIVVVAGDDPRAVPEHPSTAVLIVEVSDTTLKYDRQKAALYATSRVPEFWIINLVARTLEVHRKPILGTGSSAESSYAEIRTFSESDRVSPLTAPAVEITVADLLP